MVAATSRSGVPTLRSKRRSPFSSSPASALVPVTSGAPANVPRSRSRRHSDIILLAAIKKVGQGVKVGAEEIGGFFKSIGQGIADTGKKLTGQ